MKVKNAVEIYLNCIFELNYKDTVIRTIVGCRFLNCYENSKQEVTGAK